MTRLKQEGRTGLIPFIVAGDPSLEVTADALLALDDAGCDVIELGIPYGDPLADGPTIQDAAFRALENGANTEKVVEVLRKVTPQMKAPVVLFTYFNVVRARGIDNFCKTVRAAGASGLLVPDIPVEETAEIRQAVNAQDMELVLLVAPTSGQERMQKIAQSTQGFLYLVSVTGVTGARTEVSARVESLVKDIKSDMTDKSVCVGFGVSTKEQAKQLQGWGADGVIVGSALVKLLADGGVQQMKQLVAGMRQALDEH